MYMKKILIFLATATVVALVVLVFVMALNQKSSDEDLMAQYKNSYGIFNPPIPDSLSFAGEQIPLNTFYVYEDFEREVLVNTYWQSSTLLMLKRAHRWFPIIEPILKENNIPDDFKYLAVIESSLSNVTSSAGAKGFWQFMKATGLNYGLEISEDVDERNNVVESTKAACKYLKDSYKIFGKWTLSAASYNMGAGGLNSQVRKQAGEDFFDLSLNPETARYLYRILAIKTIFESPERYGFRLREKDLYPTLKFRTVEVDSSIISLSDFAKKNNVSYKMLKSLNPWLVSSKLKVGPGKKYIIWFPESEMLDYKMLKQGMDGELGVFGDKK